MSGAVSKDCWNLIDSYGLICTGCNCCGKFDKESMHRARFDVAVRHIKETVCCLNDPAYMSNLQQRNVVANIKFELERIEAAMAHLDFGPPEYFEVTEKDVLEAVGIAKKDDIDFDYGAED